MNQSEGITKLAVALVAVHAEIKSIGKDSTNPFFKNSYASLEVITDTVRPILAKHGLAVLQGTTSPHTDEAGQLRTITIETRLLHTSGEWISNAVVMPITKPDPQQAGASLTYGRRYGLSSLLALTTDEDDDGNTASAPSTPKAAQAKPAPAKSYPDTGKQPEDKVMPFGKSKDRKLRDISAESLASTVAWCKESDAEKFKDLIGAIETVLDNRRNTDAP